MNFTVSISALLQILILYWVILAILRAASGSRVGQTLLGVGIIAALTLAFTYIFHFEVLSRILHALLLYLAISTVVIFQPEIRRILSTVGAFNYFEHSLHNPDGSATGELVTSVIMKLSEKRLGALIAFERGISLRGYEDSGVKLDAQFSEALVTSIFTPPLPLHDGGMVIRSARISSAHAIFPVSNNPALISSGMRHRAAVGLSEDTDALVIVVSEETGGVSVAHNGRLIRYPGETARASLSHWINKAIDRQRRQRGIVGTIGDSLLESYRKFTSKGKSA